MALINKITGLARYIKTLVLDEAPAVTGQLLYTGPDSELYYKDGVDEVQLTDSGKVASVGILANSAYLGSDFTVTAVWDDVAGGDLVQVGSLSLSTDINKISGITVHFLGSADIDTGSDLVLGYQIDSEDPVPCLYEQGGAGGIRHINMMVALPSIPKGSVTIKLMAASSGGVDPVVLGASNYNLSKFSVVQY
jgi:hypothetical protein